MVDKTNSNSPVPIDLAPCQKPIDVQGMSRIGSIAEVQNNPEKIQERGSAEHACVSGGDVYYDYMAELEAPDLPQTVRASLFSYSTQAFIAATKDSSSFSAPDANPEMLTLVEEMDGILSDLQSIRDRALINLELDQKIRLNDLLVKINSLKFGILGFESEIKVVPAAINNRKKAYEELTKALNDHESPKIELLTSVLVSGSLFGLGVPTASILGQRLLVGQGLIGELYKRLLRNKYRRSDCEGIGEFVPALQFFYEGKSLRDKIIRNLFYTWIGSGIYFGGRSLFKILETTDEDFSVQQPKNGEPKHKSCLDDLPSKEDIEENVLSMAPDDCERYLMNLYERLVEKHNELATEAAPLRQMKTEWDEKLEKVTMQALQSIDPNEIVDPELKELVIDFKQRRVRHDPIDEMLTSDAGKKAQFVLDLTIAFGVAAPAGHWILNEVIEPKFFSDTLNKLDEVNRQVYKEVLSGCADNPKSQPAEDEAGEKEFFGQPLGDAENLASEFSLDPTLIHNPDNQSLHLPGRLPTPTLEMGGRITIPEIRVPELSLGGLQPVHASAAAYAGSGPGLGRGYDGGVQSFREGQMGFVRTGSSSKMGTGSRVSSGGAGFSDGEIRYGGRLGTGLLAYETGRVALNTGLYLFDADKDFSDTANNIYSAGGLGFGVGYLLQNPAMIGPAVAVVPGMQLGGNVARGETEESIRARQWSPLVEELAVLGTQAGGTLIGAGTSAATVESLAVASGMSRLAAGTGVGLVLLAVNGIYTQYRRNRDLQRAEDSFRNDATLKKDAPEILHRFDEMKTLFEANPFDAVTFYAFDVANEDQILEDYDSHLDKLKRYFQDPDPVTKAVMALMGYWFEEKYFRRWDDLSSDFKMTSRYGDGFAMDLRDALIKKYGSRVSLMRSVLKDPYLEDQTERQMDQALKRADPQKRSKHERDLQQLVTDGVLNPDEARQKMADVLLEGKLSKDPAMAPKTFVIPKDLDVMALHDSAARDYRAKGEAWYDRKGNLTEDFIQNIRQELRMKIVEYKKDGSLSPEACVVKTAKFMELVVLDLEKFFKNEEDDLDFNTAVIIQGMLGNMKAALRDYQNTGNPVYVSTTLSEKSSFLASLNDFISTYVASQK